jgi:hypothetical protein
MARPELSRTKQAFTVVGTSGEEAYLIVRVTRRTGFEGAPLVAETIVAFEVGA